ncbi:MAG: hypothetical protein WC423_16960 [Vulcanimicrobiota bacterium]
MNQKRLILFLLLFVVGSLGPARGEYTPDPRYKQADDLLRESRFVKAREIGEAMLKASPNSFEAQAILGRVHLYGEGNPGKAHYYLRKSHRTITRTFAAPSTVEGPWACYGDVLWSLCEAAMDQEKYQEAIDWITEYNRAFPHAAIPERLGWPLMKMGRMKEARAYMESAREQVKDNPDAINNILNTIGAVEYEAKNFEEALKAFEEIVQRVESGQGEKDPVFYSNAAEAARDLLDYPASEKYLLESTRHLHAYSYSTPWLALADLYLGQGRQPEAIQALERHSRHLAHCKPNIQYQKRAASQAVLGLALMACGYDLEACDLLAQVALHGDRNSGTSTKRSLLRSRNNFFYREALKQKRERLREQRSYAGWKEWLGLHLEEVQLGREIEQARRECAALAIKNGGPSAMLPPYGPNGFNCPWLTPALGEIFGDGVVAVEAGRIAVEHKDQDAEPYILAILAECTGNEELMKKCLEKLPPSQVLLRGRLHALLARASGSNQSLQQALEADPPVIRRLSMSLPVQLECSDSELKQMIEASPRFHSGEGFSLTVSGSVSSGYSGQLQGPDGSVLTRFSSASENEEEDNADARQALCEVLHQTVFAPRVNLTQADINGLDGSNLAGGVFREQLLDIMGKEGEKK